MGEVITRVSWFNQRLRIMADHALNTFNYVSGDHLVIKLATSSRFTASGSAMNLPEAVVAYRENLNLAFRARSAMTTEQRAHFRQLLTRDRQIFNEHGIPNINLLTHGRR